MKKIILALLLILLLTGCNIATPTPAPIVASADTEFMLAPNQIATLANTQLTIKLISVGGDQRCPSEIECAISGPVSVIRRYESLSQREQMEDAYYGSDDWRLGPRGAMLALSRAIQMLSVR
jgi:hypothetical protein